MQKGSGKAVCTEYATLLCNSSAPHRFRYQKGIYEPTIAIRSTAASVQLNFCNPIHLICMSRYFPHPLGLHNGFDALQQAADAPTASLYAELDTRVEENRSETSKGTTLSCQKGSRREALKMRARDLRNTVDSQKYRSTTAFTPEPTYNTRLYNAKVII